MRFNCCFSAVKQRLRCSRRKRKMRYYIAMRKSKPQELVVEVFGTPDFHKLPKEVMDSLTFVIQEALYAFLESDETFENETCDKNPYKKSRG